MVFILSLSGLEELVLSEINSPSRTQQTGDSSSVSSFSYRDMMKEAQPANQNKVGGTATRPEPLQLRSTDRESVRVCDPSVRRQGEEKQKE